MRTTSRASARAPAARKRNFPPPSFVTREPRTCRERVGRLTWFLFTGTADEISVASAEFLASPTWEADLQETLYPPRVIEGAERAPGA